MFTTTVKQASHGFAQPLLLRPMLLLLLLLKLLHLFVLLCSPKLR
jgi:hypothetical protein